jgi:uncharacterized spore protein YtfJ
MYSIEIDDEKEIRMAQQESMNTLWTKAVDGWKDGVELITRLYTVARPDSVFSAPFTAEGQTVITASEAYVGLGMGYGAGGGEGIAPRRETDPEAASEAGRVPATPVGAGYGSGGGGGGVSIGRPVAAIIINSQGVRVEPIVDVTKVALAFFTMFGSMLFMMSRMRRAARELEG